MQKTTEMQDFSRCMTVDRHTPGARLLLHWPWGPRFPAYSFFLTTHPRIFACLPLPRHSMVHGTQLFRSSHRPPAENETRLARVVDGRIKQDEITQKSSRKAWSCREVCVVAARYHIFLMERPCIRYPKQTSPYPKEGFIHPYKGSDVFQSGIWCIPIRISIYQNGFDAGFLDKWILWSTQKFVMHSCVQIWRSIRENQFCDMSTIFHTGREIHGSVSSWASRPCIASLHW